MAKKTPQKEIVARLLRQAGKRGVHTFELRQAYISNPSERIADLERAGWIIKHSGRELLHGTAEGCRYVKVSEPDVERTASTPPSPSGVLGAVTPPEGRDAGLITRASAEGSLSAARPLSPYEYEREVA